MHMKVKLWVGVVHRGQIGINADFSAELLPDFPDQGILRSFFQFDFPSGELPIIFPVAISALGRKDLIPISDDCRDDVDCFHVVLQQLSLQISSMPKLFK